ncbi:methyltransferase family protein [Sulfurimonas sp.]
MISKILVFLQFFIIFLMLLPLGTDTKYLSIGLFVLFAGLVIGLLALNKNVLGNFNIRPDIKEECKLITDGIYGYIRHPMYLSVLLSMLGIALIYFTYYELVLFSILFIVLISKLLYEESLWECHSNEYALYKTKTKRLIPFIF